MCDHHLPSLSRRQLLLAGTASLTLAGSPLRTAMADVPVDPAPNAITPEAALARLVDGNARYAANTPANRDYFAGRASRISAQYPFAAIVSCADSRVSPELAFDQGPGDLFVVRVAGNFVNDAGLASLEYGVKFLGIPLIVVLGHTHCGALSATVRAIEDKAVLPGHLPELVRAMRPAVDIARTLGAANLTANATVENVRLNANRLSLSRPILGRFVQDGEVKVVGAMYDLATGKVTLV